MSYAHLHPLRAANTTQWVGALGFVVAVFGLVVLASAGTLAWAGASQPASQATVVRVFTALACLLGWVHAQSSAHRLVRAAEVLTQRRVPQVLWRQWLQMSLRGTALVWAATSVLCVFTGALVSTQWGWLAGAVLVSWATGLSMVRTLSQGRLLPGFWAWCIAAALVLAALVIGFTLGLGPALERLNQSPWALQLVLLLTWPLGLWALWQHWATSAPRPLRSRQGQPISMWQWMQREGRRYRPMAMLADTSASTWHGSGVPFWLPALWFNLMAPQMQKFLGVWGEALDIWHPLVLLCLVVIFVPNLSCKDFHWRKLLAPGGLHRGRLGSSIARSSLEGVFILACLMAMVAWAISFVLPGAPRFDLLAFAQHYAALPFQLIFAVCVATLLRALPHPKWVFASLLALLMGAGAWVVWHQATLPAAPAWATMGWEYVVALLSLSAIALAASNQLWTAQKLKAAVGHWTPSHRKK